MEKFKKESVGKVSEGKNLDESVDGFLKKFFGKFLEKLPTFDFMKIILDNLLPLKAFWKELVDVFLKNFSYEFLKES